MDREDPRRVLTRLGVRARKGLGQHFLIDPRVAARHVSHARVTASDVVLEIGPGLGILTEGLVERARHVIAIEKDRVFARYLRDRIPEAEIILGDALDIDWPSFDLMASNLPYQISSPLTFRLLRSPFNRAVLMYQREFAKRMVASPGRPGYSRLSVGVSRRAMCEILEYVPRSAFHPPPKVNSALVRLEPHPPPFPVTDEDLYDAVVEALFGHRRKTIENGLRLSWARFVASPEALEALLSGLPYRGRRVEELSPRELALLAEAIARAKG